jgi:hypothetical protein
MKSVLLIIIFFAVVLGIPAAIAFGVYGKVFSGLRGKSRQAGGAEPSGSDGGSDPR